MELYGLMGGSHGGAYLMTVMSPEGREAVLDLIEPDPARVHVVVYETGLPQYHEMVSGGLADLITRYGIEVLDFHGWTAKKTQLGDAIFR
ncbi:MAG: hypothetical protein AAF563_05330 [Pseudomonadota bacterium]